MEQMDLVFYGIHGWLQRWGKAGKDTGLLEHKIVTFNASLMTLRNLEHFRNVIFAFGVFGSLTPLCNDSEPLIYSLFQW